MTADTPAGLRLALEEQRAKDLVLVDTPGFGPREWEAARDWARALRSHPGIDVQLVLSATTRSSDLDRSWFQWSEFGPGRLIFTRLDETCCFGGLVACAMRAAIPVSFLASGQEIPEDIEPATVPRLLALLLGGTETSQAAAA